MSSHVNALMGRSEVGTLVVESTGLRGMLSLKTDLSNAHVKAICTGLTGLDFPGQREAKCVGAHGLIWMAPDEVLIIIDHDKVADALAKIANALADVPHLALDMSDAREVMRLKGKGVREVLARLTPADMSVDGLPPMEFRRTRVGQVPAAFWLKSDELAELLCFRSVSGYVFDLLVNSAKSRPVGHFSD